MERLKLIKFVAGHTTHYISLEDRVPADHPLREIRRITDRALDHADTARLLSDDHFTVDATLMEAWASHKSLPDAMEQTPPA